MRYNLYIDCLPVDRASDIEPSVLKLILEQATGRNPNEAKAQKKVKKFLNRQPNG